MRARRFALAAALAVAPALAAADEPNGCGAFRWPIEHERAALAEGTKPVITGGGTLRYGAGLTLQLAPFTETSLPHAPERLPKVTPSYAGHFTLPAPPKPGLYTLTIDSEAWIDVIDNGAFLHPKGFSGALGCDGARKSVKFDLPGRPVDVQLSSVKDARIAVIVTAAE
jgi:hypothetical protein